MPPRRCCRFSRVVLDLRILACLSVVAFNFNQAIGQAPTLEEMQAAQDIVLPSDPATLVAMVGQSPILYGELSPKIEARIQSVMKNTAQEVPEDQIHFARVRMLRGLLSSTIQSRMMRESFLLDQVATQSAEKRREADAQMQAKARQMFFETELPDLKKQYEVDSLPDLDKKLQEKGTSLAARQREFIDAMLGHLYIRGKVSKDPSVSLAEIHEYYQTHPSEYQHRAQARWEQLTVKFANFPNKEAAHAAISAMGREAFYGGNMQAVARKSSQEPFADNGGLHEWTNQGSLASTVLDQQIFTLPTGRMSQIIEDTDAYHIIRILERKPAGMTPLADVQDEIRKVIRDQKIADSQQKALAEVQKRVPVWTIFPDDLPGSRPLPQSIRRTASQPGSLGAR